MVFFMSKQLYISKPRLYFRLKAIGFHFHMYFIFAPEPLVLPDKSVQSEKEFIHKLFGLAS